MLVEREHSMLLEGRRNSLDNETRPQLTKYLHKHDRSQVLNLVRRSLRDGHKPFPFPSVRGMVVSPHGDETIVSFGDHSGGPVLDVFVL